MAKKELKKENIVYDPSKANVDQAAMKECVDQQKRNRSSNPWATCRAQFGIGKSDIEPGQSYRQMKKKEDQTLRTDKSSAKKIAAAQKEHMKPAHPQIFGQKPAKVGIKHPVYKSELEPRMSWNQLQKMQATEDLSKKPK